MPWPSLPQDNIHSKGEETSTSSIPSHIEDSNHHLHDANQDGVDRSPVRGLDPEFSKYWNSRACHGIQT